MACRSDFFASVKFAVAMKTYSVIFGMSCSFERIFENLRNYTIDFICQIVYDICEVNKI